MDLTEGYVNSVLGHDPQRPPYDKVKAKFQKIHSVLGWETADVLYLLNEYTWDDDLALNAAVEGSFLVLVFLLRFLSLVDRVPCL